MNNLFSIGSPIVAVTLIVLIMLSIMTWSIAIYKFWIQVQGIKLSRGFKPAFWDAKD